MLTRVLVIPPNAPRFADLGRFSLALPVTRITSFTAFKCTEAQGFPGPRGWFYIERESHLRVSPAKRHRCRPVKSTTYDFARYGNGIAKKRHRCRPVESMTYDSTRWRNGPEKKRHRRRPLKSTRYGSAQHGTGAAQKRHRCRLVESTT